MSRYDRRLQSLETEVCDGLAIGWPECESERVIAYHLQDKRLEREDGESDGSFERRVRAASSAKYTILLSPSDANL